MSMTTKEIKRMETHHKEQKVEPGTKSDAEKCRMDLLPPIFLEGTAWVLTRGAEKYGDRNWEKGMSWSRCFGALMRHLWAWWGSKLIGNVFQSDKPLGTDPEWGYSHLWHAGCCLAFLMHYESRGVVYSYYDDRPTDLLMPIVITSGPSEFQFTYSADSKEGTDAAKK